MRESLPWSLLMALASCMPDQFLYLCPSALWHGAGSALGWWSRPWAVLGMLPAPEPRRQSQSRPGSRAAVVIAQSRDFSSTDIAFPGVAITTGVKSLLTLPCCTNCTISCHCYMPVISLEGLKLLSATSSAPLLPPWA